jgi:hypothetical protein
MKCLIWSGWSIARKTPGIKHGNQGMTSIALDEYRGFRHIVRHVYTFNFDPVKAQRLIEKSSTVYAAVREELLAFANFLEQHASQKD